MIDYKSCNTRKKVTMKKKKNKIKIRDFMPFTMAP